MSQPAPVGHNQGPPLTLAELIPPDVVVAQIEATITPLRARATELTDSGKRFLATYPTIDTPEADEKAAEVLAVFQRFTMTKSGRVDTARIALKAPILAADTAIGSLAKGPFAKVIEPVAALAVQIGRLSVAYKQRIEVEERQKRDAAAAQAAANAARTEKLATRGSGLVTMEDAAAAAQTAEDAQRAANARPADLTRTHGDGLGTTSLRYKRVVTIIEPDKVPRAYCIPDLALVTRAAGKAGDPFPKIEGCTIADVPDLTVRR